MTNTPSNSADFFTKELAQAYDARNSRLVPIVENMHFLIGLLLNDLPPRAHILCVGVGTGAEILSLAKAHPEWTFTGVDPSASMLEVCTARLQAAGVLDRCTLIHGYVDNVPTGENFDAALSVLVAHFVKREDRPSFYKNMVSRLKKDGTLISTEISFDLNSPQFPSMLKNWEQIQKLMGATPESLAALPQQLQKTLTVLPHAETEDFLRQCGIQIPVRFFQAFMITGWHGKK